MFCQNCGKEIEQDTQFCPHCGARQEIESTEDFSYQEPIQSDQQPQNPVNHHPHHNKNHQSSSSAGNGGSGNKGMKIVIAVLVLMVLVCGGVGGYFWHSANQKQQELARKTQEAEEIAKAAKDTQVQSEKEYSEDEVTVDGKSTDSASSDGTTSTNDQNVQPVQAEPVVTHEYTLIYEMMTWNEAQSYCLSQGGHLATATSEAEYNKILEYAGSSGLKVIWLGANRNTSTGEFAWTTGEDFSFASWAAGEPNNDQGNESYLGIMYVGGTWAMYDLPDDLSPYYSSANVGFIMERDITQ